MWWGADGVLDAAREQRGLRSVSQFFCVMRASTDYAQGAQHGAPLQHPPQANLPHGDAVARGDRLRHGAVERAATHAAEALVRDAVRGAEGDCLVVVVADAHRALVHRRLHSRVLQQVRQVGGVVIAHADGACEALLLGELEPAPQPHVVSYWYKYRPSPYQIATVLVSES